MRALVRGLPSTFARAVTMEAPAAPINLEAARAQYGAYVALLATILGPGRVIELPADDRHPDCVFVEDAAVVAGGAAVTCSIGAPSRRGEEAPVADALRRLGFAVHAVRPPALLDGGDVLRLPGCGTLLVGLSRRTNAEGARQLAEALGSGELVLPVPTAHGLHLKSAVTALDDSTLLFSDNEAGRALSAELRTRLQQQPGRAAPWQHVMLRDPLAANVLLLDGRGGAVGGGGGGSGGGAPALERHVVMQAGCAESEAVMERLCAERGLRLHKLPRLTEIAKADGALTCCSILLPDADPVVAA